MDAPFTKARDGAQFRPMHVCRCGVVCIYPILGRAAAAAAVTAVIKMLSGESADEGASE